VKTEFKVLTHIIAHRAHVRARLEQVIARLRERATLHDLTKLQPTEFDVFCETHEEFTKARFGTPEYRAVEEKGRKAVQHHYRHNRHHVKHHRNGWKDMNLIDLLELLADWKAASRRNPNEWFEDGFVKAMNRAEFPEPIRILLTNTVRDLGWKDDQLVLGLEWDESW